MGTQEAMICRICLYMCDSFEVIDGDMKNLLDVLLPNIDLVTTKQSIMCTSCTKEVIKCFDFKTNCFYTYDYIVPFVNKYSVKLSLKDVYLSQNEGIANVPGDHHICGFCMYPIKNDSAISIDVQEGDGISANMIRQCLPELDLSVIEKPVICAPCHGSLEKYFHLMTKCLIAEEKIKKYCETLDIKDKGQIKLSSLLESETGNVIINKVDDNLIDIEKVENKEGSNKPTGIKIEGTFCGENRVRMENIIEMEEQKFLHNEEMEIKTDDSDFNRFEDNTSPEPEVITKLRMEQKWIMPNLEKNLSKYHCDSCSFQTAYNNSLKRHLLIHRNPSEVKTYRCSDCSYQTKYKDALKYHLLKHSDLSEAAVFKCGSCSYMTPFKRNLTRHLLNHKDLSEITIHKCDACSFRTKSKCNLKRHLLRHKDPSEVVIFNCDSCSYQTVDKYYLKRHLRKHKNSSEVVILNCASCSYQTVNKSYLKRHLLIHKDSSVMHKCDSCSYVTVTKSYLKTHCLSHEDPSVVTMLECDSCSFQTKYKSSLIRHSSHHKNPSEDTMYECDSCSFKTISKKNLGMHLLMHKDSSEVVTLKCDSCSYQTVNKHRLKRHLLIHEDPSEVTVQM